MSGGDPANQGSLQADIASELFGGPSSYKGGLFDKNGDGIVQITMLKGEEGHQDSEQRSRYCISRLEDLGYKVQIQNAAYCNWERSLAREAMSTLYNNDIELLFANNDEMALGAVEYIQNDLPKTSSSNSSTSRLPFTSNISRSSGWTRQAMGKSPSKPERFMGRIEQRFQASRCHRRSHQVSHRWEKHPFLCGERYQRERELLSRGR
jgi:hypothetical protein